MSPGPLPPDYTPIVSWEPAFDGFGRPETPMAAQFPPIVKHPDGRIVVDWLDDPAGARIKVWRRADHPNVEALPKHTPRVVRALYTREGQIKILRGDYETIIVALDAWALFQENTE